MPVYPGAPQHSTGPKTSEGKAASCLNNFRHGFTGEFTVLPWEDQEEFDTLWAGFRAEHKPRTVTETVLVEKMSKSLWLSQRAIRMQDLTLSPELPMCDDPKQLALYLRYQTTHDRVFHKSLNELLKLRAEKRKAEIGFDSQKQKQAEEARREAAENRKKERHTWAVLFDQAKVDHQILQNIPLPGSEQRVEAAINRVIAA
jgi:hypothetical protein